MKKVWLGALVFALGVALAAPAMAIDWSATGFIGVAGFYYKNIPSKVENPPGSTWAAQDWYNDENTFWQERVRLKLTARANENLYGVIYFEMDSWKWGEKKKESPGFPRNSIGVWGADQASVEVKNAYLDFKVPQLPVWLRAGVQPYAIRPVVFMYADGPGITGRAKIEPIKLTISGGWGKVYEGDVWRSEDWDIYFLLLDLPVGPVKVGGYWLYQDVREITDGKSDEWHMHWLGLYSDGKIGPVKYNFDFAYDFGDYDAGDIDYSGWFIRGVLTYFSGNFDVGLGVMYASGDDVTDPDDYEAFIRPYGSEATAINNDSVIFGGWYTSFAGLGKIWLSWPSNYGGYMSGMWGVRAFADWQALSWLKLGFQVWYWGDTTDEADTFGTDAEDDDDIGVEIDVGAQVKIYKNLTWRTAFGYLVAGDALDQLDPVTRGSDSPDDPWVLATSLVYTF